MGWLGYAFLITGYLGIAQKRRGAFWFMMAGNVLAGAHAAERHDTPVLVACTIFFGLAVRAYILWGRPGPPVYALGTKFEDGAEVGVLAFPRGFWKPAPRG